MISTPSGTFRRRHERNLGPEPPAFSRCRIAFARQRSYIGFSDWDAGYHDDRRNQRELCAAGRLGRPLPVRHRTRPHARADARSRAFPGKQGAGLREPGVAFEADRPQKPERARIEISRRQRRSYRARADRDPADALFGPHATRNPFNRCDRAVRRVRISRASDATALQRAAFDGGADSRGRATGARRGFLKPDADCSALKKPALFPTRPLLAEPHFFCELRTRHRIIRRHHWVIRRQAPFVAVLLRSHIVLRAQMPLQRFEAFAVLQTDQIIRGHRLLQRYRRLCGLEGHLGPPRRDPQQGRVNLANQVRYLGSRRRIVAEISGDDIRRQIDEVLAGSICHGLDLSKTISRNDATSSRSISPRDTLCRIFRYSSNYGRITGAMTRTAVFRLERPFRLSRVPTSRTVVEMSPQLIDRGKPHHAFGHLRLDRTVGIQRIRHAIDNARFQHGYRGLVFAVRGCLRSVRRGRRRSPAAALDRKSTRLNSSHVSISYAVF